MKRLIFTLVFCSVIVIGLTGQRNVYTATEINYATPSPLNEFFHHYKIVEIDGAALSNMVHSDEFNDQITIDFGDDFRWDLELYPNSTLSPDFRLVVDGRQVEYDQPVSTFVGYLKDRPAKEIRLTITPEYVGGFFPMEGENVYVEPLLRFDTNAPMGQYIVYRQSDVVSKELKCAYTASNNANIPSSGEAATTRANECFIVDLAVATDASLYVAYGSSTAAVIAHIQNVMNLVTGNYTSVFTNDVEYLIAETIIATTTAQDPVVFSQKDPNTVLNDFRTWGITNFVTNFDLAQFLTNRDLTDPTVGIAYNDGGDGNGVVCTSGKYHVIQDFELSTDAVRTVAAHEIGHNWSGSHTPDGIMASMFNSGNPPITWNATSVSEISVAIQFTADNRSCLETCCGGGQGPISYFRAGGDLFCVGNIIKFENTGSPCADNFSWSFPGGTPASSTQANPTVSYNTAGSYTVSHTASFGSTNGNTISKTITVYPAITGAACSVGVGEMAGNDGLTSFRMGSIFNITGTASQDAANANLPKLGNKVIDFSCSKVTELKDGMSISVSAGFPAGSSQTARYFLDYNGDNDFNDAGEYFGATGIESGGSAGSIVNVNLTPNASIFDRILRFRIIVDNGGGTSDPCSISGTGQAEDYGVIFILNGLPVSLINFSGQRMNKAVALNWETAIEINNDYYVLERSVDGRNFSELSKISGAGTTDTEQRYSYLDQRPLSGLNYYRLKQVDFDGTVKYIGDIVTVKMPEVSGMQVFPNPAMGEQISVRLTETQDSETTLAVYDIKGQLLFSNIYSTVNGVNNLDLDINSLPQGVYLIKAISEARQQTVRFVKSK